MSQITWIVLMLIHTEGPREDVIAAGSNKAPVVIPANEDEVTPLSTTDELFSTHVDF